jgi:hypothetical protein
LPGLGLAHQRELDWTAPVGNSDHDWEALPGMGSQGQAVIERLLARVTDLEFCEHAPRDGPRDQHPAHDYANSAQQKQSFPDTGDARGAPTAAAGPAPPQQVQLSNPAKPISKARISARAG